MWLAPLPATVGSHRDSEPAVPRKYEIGEPDVVRLVTASYAGGEAAARIRADVDSEHRDVNADDPGGLAAA